MMMPSPIRIAPGFTRCARRVRSSMALAGCCAIVAIAAPVRADNPFVWRDAPTAIDAPIATDISTATDAPPATLLPPAAAVEELPPPAPSSDDDVSPAISPSPADNVGIATSDAGATRAELLLRAARNAVSLHDVPEALARFEELLALTPQDHQARFEYAGLLSQAERYSAAQEQLQSLVAAQGQVSEYRLALSDLLLRLKLYAAARDELRMLLADRRQERQAAIRIARTYAAEHRLGEARQVFDEHVQKFSDLTPSDTCAVARLLLDMERPADARHLLAPLREADSANEEATSLLILADVRLNQRIDALSLINPQAPPDLADTGLWLELATELYQEYAYAEAAALLQRICRQEPDLAKAKLALARTYLRLFEVDAARQVLSTFGGDLCETQVSTVMIDYHTVVGEYSQAIGLAKKRLRDNPQDIEAYVLLGNAYHAMRQFPLAHSTYCAGIAQLAGDDEDRRRELEWLIAKNDFFAQRFDNAIGLLERLLDEHPTDFAARILLIETLSRAKCFDQAAHLTRGTENRNPRQRFDLNVQWGYVLLEQGRAGEAAGEFALLAADPNGHLPDVAYGLYRAAKLLNQPQTVRTALALGPSSLAPAAAWGAGFADRAMRFCDCGSAAAVLDDALAAAPKNLVLLIRRGEAAQQCDCGCRGPCHRCFPKVLAFCADDCAARPLVADGWFRAALTSSPTNIRARLGLARALNKHLEYDQAGVEYKALLEFLPHDVNLIRETARMIEGRSGIEQARSLYVKGEQIVAQDDAPLPAAPATGFGAARLAGPEPGAVETLPGGALLAGELRAKYLRGWRYQQAIPVYQGLIEAEPTNEAALFDLGQSYSALNRTQCAIDAYEQLLEVDPCHRDAATALLRNQLDLRPKGIAAFDFLDQRGRQGLANVTWTNYTLAERQPLGDENEFIEFGYTERILQPTDDRADVGEVPFVRWQEKFALDSLLFADLSVEQYQYGLKTRPTFHTGFDVLTANGGEVRFTGFLENYFPNGEAIRQDIYLGGVQLNLVARPLRLWTLSGYYRVAAISDHNFVNWLNVHSDHLLRQGRRQLRGLINLDFYSFEHQTVFGPIPGSLAGSLYPYWSPAGYSVVTAGLEHKEWLSCDTFKAGNQHWYSAFFGGAVDSNGIGYFFFNSRWQRDIDARLTWTVETNLIRSPNQTYNVVGVTTYGVLRFP